MFTSAKSAPLIHMKKTHNKKTPTPKLDKAKLFLNGKKGLFYLLVITTAQRLLHSHVEGNLAYLVTTTLKQMPPLHWMRLLSLV